MRFQPIKYNMMQLTNKNLNKIQASYTLEGTVLENVDNIKYLGVTITNDLKWNTHISNICTKANRTLGFLRRTLFSCPQNVKEAAYRPVYIGSCACVVKIVVKCSFEYLSVVHHTRHHPRQLTLCRVWRGRNKRKSLKSNPRSKRGLKQTKSNTEKKLGRGSL